MSRRTHAASSILLTAIVFLMQGGCRREVSPWDSVQEATEGKTAAESSRDRLGVDPIPAGRDQDPDADLDLRAEYSDEELGPLPPFTPDAASTRNSDPIEWKPIEIELSPPTEPEIDLSALATGDPLPGSEFNKFFPEQSGDYDMVAKQEKSGFAQYSLRQDGDEIGQLSITDLRSNPAAAIKFRTPDMSIANYPAKKDGSKGTTLLVAGRFQVKIRSPGGQLNQQDRTAWMKKFDLDGVASLAN